MDKNGAPLSISTLVLIDDDSNKLATSDSNGDLPRENVGASVGVSVASSLTTLTSVSALTDVSVAPKKERWWTITLQVSIPFFLAGVGTIGAGVILGSVKDTEVFCEINALYIMVSSLLGLKGNLDMCLASRLSTLSNMGEMNKGNNLWTMIFGNIALVQVQAIVAAFCVSIFAVSVTAIVKQDFDFSHALILSASGITTATTSCFILDWVMIGVILLSQQCKMNPDNVATPLAASIGDVVSVSVLSAFSSLFFKLHETKVWILYLVIGAYLLLLPLWVFYVYRNEYTKPILKSGWVPVLSALMISGLGGLVMDMAGKHYDNIVVFQPIINGIGGNLVSVQASRISTMLHQSSMPGIIPSYTRLWASPCAALFRGLPHARTARILFALSIVGQTLFVFAADFVHTGTSTVSYQFVLSYLTASSIQVLLLLYLAHFLIHFMWVMKTDPDNSAIPFLTAIGDLTGSALLAIAFIFLDYVLHTPYTGIDE